eukprot:scaffold157101_cov31-Tisochrysis_lutea.AAC.3
MTLLDVWARQHHAPHQRNRNEADDLSRVAGNVTTILQMRPLPLSAALPQREPEASGSHGRGHYVGAQRGRARTRRKERPVVHRRRRSHVRPRKGRRD